MVRSFLRFAILSVFSILFCAHQSFALYPSDKIEVVLNEADSYLGVKWKMGGTTRRNIDCSALVQNSFKKAGFNIPRTSRSQYSWNKGVKLRKKDTYQKGDLLFFSSGGHHVGHVGIVSEVQGDQIYFIHSSSNNGKVAYDNLEDYRRIFVGGRRLFEPVQSEDFFAHKPENSKPFPSKKKKKQDAAFEWVPNFPESENTASSDTEFIMEEAEDEVELSFDFREEKPKSKRRQRTSTKRLTYDDIKDLSPCEIRILKNTIYARHGYEFHKNETMRAHFESLDWYQDIEHKSRNEFFVRSQFSVTDKVNVAFLKEYEGQCEGEEREEAKIDRGLAKIKKFRLKNILQGG